MSNVKHGDNTSETPDESVKFLKLLVAIMIGIMIIVLGGGYYLFGDMLHASKNGQGSGGAQVASNGGFKSTIEPLPGCSVSEVDMISDPVVAAYIEKHVTRQVDHAVKSAVEERERLLMEAHRTEIARLGQRNAVLNSANGELTIAMGRTENNLIDKMNLIEEQGKQIASLKGELVRIANASHEATGELEAKADKLQSMVENYQAQEAMRVSEAAEREAMFAREAKAIEDKMLALKQAAADKKRADEKALKEKVLAEAEAEAKVLAEAEKAAKLKADKEKLALEKANKEAVALATKEKADEKAKAAKIEKDNEAQAKKASVDTKKVESVAVKQVQAKPVENNLQKIAKLRLKAKEYADGIGVNPSIKTAAEYYEQAADLGDIQSMHALAVLYERGHAGFNKDEAKAIQWYTRAADKGYAISQHNLGAIKDRQGDKKAAFNYYLKAAEQNLAIDQFNVGAFYLMGDGVDADEAKGLEWMKRAAANGHEQAKKVLMDYAGS